MVRQHTIMIVFAVSTLLILQAFALNLYYITDALGTSSINLSNTLTNFTNSTLRNDSIKTKIEPIDLVTDSDKHLLPSEKLAQELHTSNPEQIAALNLEDFPSSDLIDAFTKLSIFDLDKTLKSLSEEQLREILVNVIEHYR